MSQRARSPFGYALVALAIVVGSIIVTTSLAESAPIGSLAQFQAVEPCRIVDTRGTGAAGQVGDIYPGETRNFDVVGYVGAPYFLDQGAPGCDIPSSATAVELTFTSVEPYNKGFLRAWPASSGSSAAGATVLNYTGGLNLNPTNSVTVAIGPGPDGELYVRNYGGFTFLVIDVTGYYQ